MRGTSIVGIISLVTALGCAGGSAPTVDSSHPASPVGAAAARPSIAPLDEDRFDRSVDVVPAEANHPAHAGTPSPSDAGATATYECPMHPEVVSDKPGECPKCGMALTPKESK